MQGVELSASRRVLAQNRGYAQNPRAKGEQTGRVENRRSGVSLPVAADAAFARVASVRFGLVLFPVLAHRTEQARFAHSALGESDTRSPTESWSSRTKLDEPKLVMQGGFRIPFGRRPS